MQVINSKDNQYLKLARSLQAKKARIEHRCYVAEGVRLAEEAAEYAECSFALFAVSAFSDQRTADLANKFAARGVPCYQVDDDLLARAAATEQPQGVLAVVRMPEPERLLSGGRYYAYADNIADPGNLGAILRSAHAAGCAALLLSPQAADQYNPKTVRASMGAIFKLPVYRCVNDENALALMRELNVKPLIAASDGTDIRDCAALLAAPHVWVLGSEAAGVSDFWRDQASASIKLPMAAGAESLNVAAAAAVLFYQSYFSCFPR